MAKGAAWMVVLQSADRVLGFISMLVLARLLVPADFGLVALGMAVVGSLTAFSEFGFDLALIQNQSAGRRHYDTAWTLTLLRGWLLTGLLFGVSEWNADLMGDERLVNLVYVLALIPFIESFINIGIVDFRKDLNFKKEFLYRLSSRLGGVVTTVTLAFMWGDYWALAVGQITASTLRLILSFTLHPYRPRFSFAAWRDLFHFSKWLFLNGLAQFASRRASTFVVGLFLTPTAVGLFAISGEIMNTVSQALVAPVKRTFFPGFAKLTQDMEAMRRVLLSGYALTVLVSAPLCIGIGMTAEFLVPVAFGSKWLETVPIIQILVLSALANSLQGPVRPLLLALNRPEMVTALSVVNAIVIIPALVIGTWLAGLEGAAWALVIENTAMMIVQHALLRRFLQLSLTDVLGKIWPSLLSCALMAVAVWALKRAMHPTPEDTILQDLLGLAVVAAGGALVYVAGLLAFWAASGRPAGSPEGLILDLLRKRLLKAPAKAAGAVTGGGKTGT
ncbi:lipopolysaccharide biosynthesis protein [Pelagibius sp. 7325]|uniref:lipopolysaccharide biosynthesis protein n=1 Tax=Pelagibius sp. 7325 TaxID=3131994 RepID=UPI0030EB4577